MANNERRALQNPDPRISHERDRTDITAEVTGRDATPREAELGGQGPDLPYLYRDSVENDDPGVRFEADPAHAEDIVPDRIERRESSEEETDEDREVTARPREEVLPADDYYRER